MNPKTSSLVTWLSNYLDKWVNFMFKGQTEYEIYKVNNVYLDGYVEVISEADANGTVYLQMLNLDDVSTVAIDILETDVEPPKEV